MASALTSWKEIAQHLGKGVRTVQRWEREGLPVRRPKAGQKGRVLAFPEELDRWVLGEYTRAGEPVPSDLDELRLAVAKLLTENESLRRDLKALMGMPGTPDTDGHNGSLLQWCAEALEESILVRGCCAELMRRNAAARQACADTVSALKGLDEWKVVGQSLDEKT